MEALIGLTMVCLMLMWWPVRRRETHGGLVGLPRAARPTARALDILGSVEVPVQVLFADWSSGRMDCLTLEPVGADDAMLPSGSPLSIPVHPPRGLLGQVTRSTVETWAEDGEVVRLELVSVRDGARVRLQGEDLTVQLDLMAPVLRRVA